MRRSPGKNLIPRLTGALLTLGTGLATAVRAAKEHPEIDGGLVGGWGFG